MSDVSAQLERSASHWDGLGWPRPDVALVSGTGLSVELAGGAEASRPLAEFMPFPVREVMGHPHEVALLTGADGRTILYQRGRLHSYQGYDAHETVYMVRLAALLGARVLIMTNAAGGLAPSQRPGDLVLIKDHLNLIGLNPLRGELPPAWGPRFPDMTAAYDPGLRRLARSAGERLGIELTEGVYAGIAGPSYETPAEVKMLRTVGADLVGMSTVLEVIAARHLGVRCLCFSLVTNLASGVAEGPLHHEEVLDEGRAAADRVARLLEAILEDPGLLADRGEPGER